MKLNIAICDDENRILTHTSSLIDIYQFQHLDTNLSVDCYTSGESLLENYTQPRQYHILLLDIEMPGMNGIETARQIRNTIDRNAIIVFISSYPEYMQESFSVPAKTCNSGEYESIIRRDYRRNHQFHTYVHTHRYGRYPTYHLS